MTLPHDPNGVTWLPAWKRYGYSSHEAWIEHQAGASTPEPRAACGKPATGIAYFNYWPQKLPPSKAGASPPRHAESIYCYWPQEQPPPYPADDEGRDAPA